jgi:hypothetical protein
MKSVSLIYLPTLGFASYLKSTYVWKSVVVYSPETCSIIFSFWKSVYLLHLFPETSLVVGPICFLKHH